MVKGLVCEGLLFVACKKIQCFGTQHSAAWVLSLSAYRIGAKPGQGGFPCGFVL